MSAKDTKTLEKPSSNNDVVKDDALKVSGKTDEEIMDTIKLVQTQKNQHLDNANKAKQVFEREMNLVTKAQGFIEIALKMLPKEKVEELIKVEQENNDS
mgnify:CR=1 FL=1